MSNSTKPPSRRRGPSRSRADKLDDRSKAHQVALLQMWTKIEAHQRIELRDLALLYSVSSGLPSQYLYGHQALNEKWMLRFALYLKVAPQDIWSDWEYGALTHCPSPELILVNTRWPLLATEVQTKIVRLCRG